jgi:hypothetical protein
MAAVSRRAILKAVDFNAQSFREDRAHSALLSESNKCEGWSQDEEGRMKQGVGREIENGANAKRDKCDEDATRRTKRISTGRNTTKS